MWTKTVSPFSAPYMVNLGGKPLINVCDKAFIAPTTEGSLIIKMHKLQITPGRLTCSVAKHA